MEMVTGPPVRGYRATMTKPHDGDSFWVLCDTGFSGRAEPELRLLDVHAPELRAMRLPPRGQPGGGETTSFVSDWMTVAEAQAWRDGVRWYLWVETVMTKVAEPTERQSFTRYLATVWRIADHPALGPADPVLSLNHQITTFLSGHPDWPPGD
jgi:hypothetical protein